MARTQPKIRVYWENPPGAALTIERLLPSGRIIERALGPRGLLDLDEAAEVLDRPRDQVLRAIRAGFLRARRRGRALYVTVQACTDFLREEQADIEEQERTLARIRAGREPAIPWEIARRRL
jgi:hypothetical protein